MSNFPKLKKKRLKMLFQIIEKNYSEKIQTGNGLHMKFKMIFYQMGIPRIRKINGIRRK